MFSSLPTDRNSGSTQLIMVKGSVHNVLSKIWKFYQQELDYTAILNRKKKGIIRTCPTKTSRH